VFKLNSIEDITIILIIIFPEVEIMSRLVCSSCGEEYPLGTFLPCSKCGDALFTNYDLDSLSLNRGELRKSHRGLWKYKELLPLGKGRIVSLGEGETPLINCNELSNKMGLEKLYVKNEGYNPTGSFKDRYATVVVSHAIGQKISKFYCFSSGNHAAALSCYTARAGLTCLAFVYPKTTEDSIFSTVKLAQSMLYGAKVVTPIRREGVSASRRGLDFYREAFNDYGWYPAVVQPINPYLIEGYKTIAYEISEQLAWKVPDAVIMPTESGDGLLGLWKGFKEFFELGFIEKIPKIISSQFGIEEGGYTGHRWSKEAIEKSMGCINYTQPKESLEFMKFLAKCEGLSVEPISASSVASIPNLLKRGYVNKSDVIVAIATGNGIKHPNLANELSEKPVQINVGEEFKALKTANIYYVKN
jgi:threonine synthase